MKNSLTLLLFTLSIIIFSCSSPEKEGKDIGIKYCNCLGEIKSVSKILTLKHKKDSCDGIIKNDWLKYESEYKLDAEKWKQFTSGYDNTTQKTFEEYKSKISLLIDEAINGNLWVKEGEKNTSFYLVKFENNSFKAINCRGEITYKLVADTLKFNDKNNTNIILEITSNKKMILTDVDHKSQSVYHLAELKDEIIGRWKKPYWEPVCLFTDGSCVIEGNGYYSGHGSYTFKDNVLNMGFAGASKITMNNIDGFTSGGSYFFGQSYFTRIKSKLPENVDFLFKE